MFQFSTPLAHLNVCLLVLTGLFLTGCGGNSAPPRPAVVPSIDPASSDLGNGGSPDRSASGHTHERGTKLIADAGPYHALLTAHLASSGNELDIYFETPVDTDPQPVAVPLESLTAQATTGDGESHTLTFEPAPIAERPAGEKPETCSHFVAKAPWMKPEDDLLLVARFSLNGQEVVARWKSFVPGRFAHNVE
ncbi:MAG: hypothetical protein EHM42_14860 [Planctomycetaceae bacterium]|nr:MAG: hypothetical protein EHM42_14860 [Planctomycetaceae bacterium]